MSSSSTPPVMHRQPSDICGQFGSEGGRFGAGVESRVSKALAATARSNRSFGRRGQTQGFGNLGAIGFLR